MVLEEWWKKQVELRSGGPRRNGLKLATSKDGLHFEKLNKFLTEFGDVPCMITTPKGVIIAAYQIPDGMAISKSEDNGKTWSPTKVKIKGLPKNVTRGPCDPSIVLLPDGKLRLYFITSSPNTKSEEAQKGCTRSAISTDFEVFEFEEGIRFIDLGRPLQDQSIIKIGNLWHYYAPHFTRPGDEVFHNYHLTSRDGLNFKPEMDIILRGISFLGNLCQVDDCYRFYGTYNGVSSASSKDGFEWVLDPGLRLSGSDVFGDAAVTRLKNGTFLMIHAIFPIRESKT